MATSTTHSPTVSPLAAMQKRLERFREECVITGTYLAAPSEEFSWYTVPGTKTSYLIRTADAPPAAVDGDPAVCPPLAEVDPAERPAMADLSMILKVFFFTVPDGTCFADVPSRFLRTIGSSVLKHIGLQERSDARLSKRPSLHSLARLPHTSSLPMTTNRQKSTSPT